MELNADFDVRAVVHSEQIPWIASPMPGVDRRMLDRIGDEVARATTIVRYAPGSRFAPHVHDGGEEFVVLDGVFQDEHGDYPAGTYVRNPPTSRHTPGSEPGCTILVKLWQFAAEDRTSMTLDMAAASLVRDEKRAGVTSAELFADARECVRLEHWDAGAHVDLALPDGGEFFVLRGGFTESGTAFGARAWLRLPRGSRLSAHAGPEGAEVWTKTGHLRYVRPPGPR
ncbi:MAG: cupin domain-containing protein [Myxococcota bacterium]